MTYLLPQDQFLRRSYVGILCTVAYLTTHWCVTNRERVKASKLFHVRGQLLFYHDWILVFCKYNRNNCGKLWWTTSADIFCRWNVFLSFVLVIFNIYNKMSYKEWGSSLNCYEMFSKHFAKKKKKSTKTKFKQNIFSRTLWCRTWYIHHYAYNTEDHLSIF